MLPLQLPVSWSWRHHSEEPSRCLIDFLESCLIELLSLAVESAAYKSGIQGPDANVRLENCCWENHTMRRKWLTAVDSAATGSANTQPPQSNNHRWNVSSIVAMTWLRVVNGILYCVIGRSHHIKKKKLAGIWESSRTPGISSISTCLHVDAIAGERDYLWGFSRAGSIKIVGLDLGKVFP